MSNIIEIQHLQKSYGEVRAVDDLSFRVGEGELFAFLGVNGAGKSTTIHILCGQLAKDGGSVLVNGLDIDRDMTAIKRELGVVFQHSVLDAALTVYDNLQSRAALYGIHGAAFEKRLSELAELLDFTDLLGRTLGKLSGGQRRRIDIARALLHSPRIHVLDEPTTGLHFADIDKLLHVLHGLADRGNTVLIIEHNLDVIKTADWLVDLGPEGGDKGGTIVAEGTPYQVAETPHSYTGKYLKTELNEAAAFRKANGLPPATGQTAKVNTDPRNQTKTKKKSSKK